MMQKGDPFDELMGLSSQSLLESSEAARSHHLGDAQHQAAQLDASPHAMLSTERKATTRRRGKPKSQPSDVDAQGKRKRHADAERERVHRKQTDVVRMRDEVVQLERHLQSLSTSSSSDVTSQSTWPSLVDDDTLAHDVSPIEKRDLYVRLLTESGSLRREKASLQAKLDDCGLLEAAVESLLKDLIDATTKQPVPPNPRTPPAAVQHITYRDVLQNEVYDMMRDLVNASKRFSIHDDASFPSNDPTNALDWSALCEPDDTDVRFSLTKTFYPADLEKLASSVWLAFHDIHVSQQIFSPTIRVEVLQRISDDILIVHWQIDCRKVAPYVGHCRNLVFRWKTPDGLFIGCRTIDEIEPMDPTVVKSNPTNGAFDQFYWAKFTQDPSGRGCQVTFAGRVGVGNGTSKFARFLCTEIPISIFRWENMVVGPLFNFDPSVVV